jgi:hypothetical protein
MSVSNINSASTQQSTALSTNPAKAKPALPKDLPTQISQLQNTSAIQRMQTTMPGTNASALDTTGQAANKNQATVNNANVASASSNLNPNITDKVIQKTSHAVLSFKSLKKAADPSKSGQKLSASKENSGSKNTKNQKSHSEEDKSNNFFQGIVGFFQ